MKRNFIQYFSVVFLALVVPLSTVELVGAETYSYDASSGQLPTDQGFSVYDDASSPAPYLQGGALHQGLTWLYGFQYWNQSFTSMDYGIGFQWDARLHVVYSNYAYPGYCGPGQTAPRCGYIIAAVDYAGRQFSVMFADNLIMIITSNFGGGVSANFDTTDGYHDYRFIVSAGVGALYVDGDSTPLLTAAIGGGGQGTPNVISFGDGSSCGESETWLSSISFTAGAPLAVELLSFDAESTEGGVDLTWETASEIDSEGFHLWRAEEAQGEFTRITESLIPSEGGPAWGAGYTLTDHEVIPGQTYFYKLEDINIYGTSTMHGPVDVAVEVSCFILAAGL